MFIIISYELSFIFIRGRKITVNKIINANIINTEDQDIASKRMLVKGGPIICPAEPAAVVIPRANDLCSGEVVRPTTAKIGPKPVPAIPNPITIFNN